MINCVAGLKESVLCKRITRAIADGEMVENTDFNQRLGEGLACFAGPYTARWVIVGSGQE